MRPLLDTLVANFTLMMEFLRVAPPAAQVRSLPAQLRGETRRVRLVRGEGRGVSG